MSLLRQLVDALSHNVSLLEAEYAQDGKNLQPHLWEAKQFALLDDVETPTSSLESFELQQKIIADMEAIKAVITPTCNKLLELSLCYEKSLMLNLACDLAISDAIEEFGGTAHLKELANHVGINEHKLGTTILHRREKR